MSIIPNNPINSPPLFSSELIRLPGFALNNPISTPLIMTTSESKPDIISSDNIGYDQKFIIQKVHPSIRWTKEEKAEFMKMYETFGTHWKKYVNVIITKTLVQIRAYGKRFIKKKRKEKQFKNFDVAPANDENSDKTKLLSGLFYMKFSKIGGITVKPNINFDN